MGESHIAIAGTAEAGEAPEKKETGASRARGAKSLLDFIAFAPSATQLSKEGEAFVDDIVAQVKSMSNGKIELNVVKASLGNCEARIFTTDELAVAYLFHSTYVRPASAPHAPTCTAANKIDLTMKNLGLTQKLLDLVVVMEHEYDDATTKAKNIVTKIMSYDGELSKVTAAEFSANGLRYAVTTRLDEVDSYLRNFKKTLPYHTIGVRLDVLTQERNERTGQIEEIRKPIGAVTGFTYFTKTMNYTTGPKFQPHVVIDTSGMVSPITTTGMCSVLLSIAVTQFITYGGWMEEFSNFGPSGRNFGILVLDKAGKPYFITDVEHRDEFVRQWFQPGPDGVCHPILELDLQEGAEQFPCVREFVANPDKLKKEIDDFTGGSISSAVGDIRQAEFIRYDGFIQIGDRKNGEWLDTRWVDFLNMVNPKGTMKISRDLADALLSIPNPMYGQAIEDQAKLLEQFWPADKIALLYCTHRLVLKPEFVNALGSSIAALLPNVSFGSTSTNMMFDSSRLVGMSANYQFSGGAVAQQFGYGGTWVY